VKFFNSVDGYGFIRRRQSDVYVHRSDIADGKLLLRGDKVCFDVIEEDQRLVALRVTGGTGGFGLTIGSNVDRSTVKDLHGTIKKFFPDKGWGFIIQDSGGPNLFFHSNAIESGDTGSTNLVVGSRVRYESMWDEKRGSRKAQRVAMEETNVPPESKAEVTDKLLVDPEDLVVLATSDSDGEEWELVT